MPTVRNPTWVRDEEILLLDLYLSHHPTSVKDPRVVDLSRLLRTLPLHPNSARTPAFRNPTGVFMKLGNLRHIDPEYAGKGLWRVNRLAAVVWKEFAGNSLRIGEAAAAIRRAAAIDSLREPLRAEQEGELYALEGRVLFRLHRVRERQPRLVLAKKQQAMRDHGKLVCEACGFDPISFYGPIGEGAIECHHVIPLSRLASETHTRLADLVLICANCHRLLHRGVGAPTIGQLQERAATREQSVGAGSATMVVQP